LKNDALRQAVMMAVDGKTVADVTVGGLYTYGYSVLPSNLDYNYDKLTYKFNYDKAAAEKLLDDAGIKDTDGDGIRELDGKPIKLEWITYENRGLADMAQAGQQQLKEIGIDANVNVGDSESEWNKMVNGEYDLCSSNWTTVGTGDPTEYLANWNGGNKANYCNYSNAKFDEAYTKLLTEFDDQKRKELITTMQQCLLDDAAVLVHGYYNSSMISNASQIANAPIHTADYYWITTEITPAG
jgi:peptide/nickel transport system substrate-binding protein